MATTVSTSRSARYARWLAVPVGLVVSAVLVWQASYAAFTDTTANRGNSWTAGTVTITDTRNGVAMFEATNLAPGAEPTGKTITATYEGTLDANVKLYGEHLNVLTPTGDGLQPVSGAEKTLADYIHLTIVGNEGATFGAGPQGEIFRGTLATFAKNYGSGNSSLIYSVPGGDVHEQGTFKFTYWVDAGAPNSVQGQQVNLDFVAEATSKP